LRKKVQIVMSIKYQKNYLQKNILVITIFGGLVCFQPTKWYFPHYWKRKASKPTFKFIHPHAKIINEIKDNGVQLIGHATSLLHLIMTNVWYICLSKEMKSCTLTWSFIAWMMDLGIQCNKWRLAWNDVRTWKYP
jgi:hypothetical protein